MVLSPWFDAIRNRLAFSPRRVPARRRRLGGSTLGTSARTTLMNSAVELLESRITPVTGTFAFAVPTNSVTENVVTQTIIVNLMTDVPLGAGDTMSVLVFETGTGSASPGGVDYTGLVANPTQVTFTGDGVAMAFITTIEVSVDIVEDALAEEDETIDFDLSNATASFIGDTAVIDGANDTHELTILDDDAVTGTFAFAVAAGSILENATPTYDITINLTTDFALRSGDSMSVDVTDLLTGTALLANFDYSAFGTATVTFTSADVNGAPVGTANTQTYTKTVSVTILEDLVIEGDETINFGLSNDGATNVLDATSIAAVNVGESVTHVATITDEDVGTVSITASDPSADEAVPADGEFTVTLGGGVTADDSIDVFYTITGTATAGGTDYTTLSGMVTIPAFATSVLIPVTGIFDDLLYEGPETIIVTLDFVEPQFLLTAIVADPVSATVTIVDNDPIPTVSIGDAVTVVEGAFLGTQTFVVTLSAISGVDVTVGYQTLNGTASSPADFIGTSNTYLTISAGSISGNIVVAIVNDLIDEPTESYSVKLFSATGATFADTLGVGSITNDDPPPTISIGNSTVPEGSSGKTKMIFPVTLSALSTHTITVKYTTVNGSALSGSDYGAKNSTLIFLPGETTKDISILTNGDKIDENNEGFTVVLSAPTNATIAVGTGTGTITDDDAAPNVTINDVSVTEVNTPNTSNAKFTVTLSAPSSFAVTVPYSTAGGTATSGTDFTAIPVTNLVIPAGSTTGTFNVVVKGDNLAELSETFSVNLGVATNGTVTDFQGIGTIVDNDPKPSVSISTITPGGHTETAGSPNVFKVALSAIAGSPVTVLFSTANASGATAATAGLDYTAQTSVLVTIPAGDLFVNVPVGILGDTKDEPDEIFHGKIASATLATIGTAQATAKINDNDSPPTITILNTSVAEGSTVGSTTMMTFTISLSAASGKTVTMNFATQNGTALSSSDYTAKTGTVTFAAGDTVKTVTVLVKQDTTLEANETLLLKLSNAVNAVFGNTTGIGTILNDD